MTSAFMPKLNGGGTAWIPQSWDNSGGPTVQAPVVPTTGQTVNMTDSAQDGILQLSPAGTLAALTVNLPSDAQSQLGQQRTIMCTQIVTALTLNQIGGSAVFLGAALTALAANQSVTFTKTAANTWTRT
jgi:hypothetical protein